MGERGGGGMEGWGSLCACRQVHSCKQMRREEEKERKRERESPPLWDHITTCPQLLAATSSSNVQAAATFPLSSVTP